LEEWAALSLKEYAEIANGASKGASNDNCVVPMLSTILKEKKLPDTMEELIRFYGFGHKSAALILKALTGEENEIPVDRHLIRCFGCLQWLDWQTSDQTKMALCVQSRLPKRYWAEVNDILAGL
jgi:endonuclease III